MDFTSQNPQMIATIKMERVTRNPYLRDSVAMCDPDFHPPPTQIIISFTSNYKESISYKQSTNKWIIRYLS